MAFIDSWGYFAIFLTQISRCNYCESVRREREGGGMMFCLIFMSVWLIDISWKIWKMEKSFVMQPDIDLCQRRQRHHQNRHQLPFSIAILLRSRFCLGFRWQCSRDDNGDGDSHGDVNDDDEEKASLKWQLIIQSLRTLWINAKWYQGDHFTTPVVSLSCCKVLWRHKLNDESF